MSKTTHLLDDYYFIPFGKEKGGYLDFLGLHPGAAEVEVSKKENDYRIKIDRDFKTQRKEYKKQLADKTITQEEYDAFEKGLKEEADRNLADLNKLKENFNAELAKKRDAQNKGKRYDNVVWLDMYKPIKDQTELVQLFRNSSPLPVLSDQTANDLISQVNISLDEGNLPKLDLAYRQMNTKHVLNVESITIVSETLAKTKLLSVFLADILWFDNNKRKGVKVWAKTIEKWANEIREIIPELYIDIESSLYNSTTIDNEKGKFEVLNRPTSLAIEELKTEEIRDITKIPERKGDMQFDFLDVFLKQMADQDSKKADSGWGAGGTQAGAKQKSKEKSSDELFQDMLLEMLSKQFKDFK